MLFAADLLLLLLLLPLLLFLLSQILLYDEDVAIEAENWFCPACDTLLDDSEMGLEDVEIRPISGNNVDALKKGVELSLDEVPLDSFVRGFESHRMFIKKLLESEGDNNYDMHWRRHAQNK